MNKNIAINLVRSKLNLRCKFIYNGSRNQKEVFYGTIKSLYPAIFLIRLDDGSSRSFSYNDVIINNLKILN
jgi:uncharacterized protein Veg